MRAMAAGFLIIGLMLLGGGVAYGFAPVSVASGTSCGSAFAKSGGEFDGLTDSGEEACTQARTAHLPAAVGLIVAGVVALVGALVIEMRQPIPTKPLPASAADPVTAPNEPTEGDPAGPAPQTPPWGLYGSKG